MPKAESLSSTDAPAPRRNPRRRAPEALASVREVRELQRTINETLRLLREREDILAGVSHGMRVASNRVMLKVVAGSLDPRPSEKKAELRLVRTGVVA